MDTDDDDVELTLDLEPEPDPVPDAPVPEAAGDPAAEAFARLEGELALMRRAVQHLAAERADNIAVFRVDRKTGGLNFTGHYAPVGNPSCIVFR